MEQAMFQTSSLAADADYWGDELLFFFKRCDCKVLFGQT